MVPEQMPASRLTIAELAAAAGVSIMTVPRVLNNRPDIAPTTCARVERLIVETGFVRSRAGRVAAALLLQLIAGEDVASTRVELAASLIIRDSCSPPATGAADGEARRAPRVADHPQGIIIMMKGERI